MMLRILTIIFLFHMVNGDKLLSPAQVPNEERSTNRYRSDKIVEMGTRVVKQQPVINFTGLKQNASVRINNGIKVESSTEYPFIVAIATVIDEVGYVVCGGTLISPFTILTAAHCAEQADIVSIGIHDFGDGASNAYSEVWDIEEIIVHPAFVLTQKIPENDIALLRIAGPSNFPSIKLDDGNYTENFQGGFDSSINLEDGENLTLAGWGMTEEGFGSSVLLKSTVNYITNGMCKLLWKSHTLITDDMMCTYSSESSGCNGDSGGPLFIEGSPSTDTVQVGVISWGPKSCEAIGYPNVYTRVSIFYEWIQNYLNQELMPLNVQTDISEPVPSSDNPELNACQCNTSDLSCIKDLDIMPRNLNSTLNICVYLESDEYVIKEITTMRIAKNEFLVTAIEDGAPSVITSITNLNAKRILVSTRIVSMFFTENVNSLIDVSGMASIRRETSKEQVAGLRELQNIYSDIVPSQFGVSVQIALNAQSTERFSSSSSSNSAIVRIIPCKLTALLLFLNYYCC